MIRFFIGNPSQFNKSFHNYFLELSNNYKIKNLEKTDYAVITFPLKNKLSYMVWMIRVYPVLWEYLIENKYSEEWPAIEMYDMKNNLIYYMVEIK